MSVLRAILLCLLWALPLQAQEVLEVPFTRVTTFMEKDASGQASGFGIDLSRLIGEEIGAEIRIRNVDGPRDVIAAQISGRTQMLAGIVQLPPLRATSVFSDPVAMEDVTVAALAGRTDLGDLSNPRGLRIGIVPPIVGAGETEVLRVNIPVEFASAEAAVQALFLRDVDAVIVPASITFAVAKRMGLDGRIRFAPEPIRTVERVVALHESRADLLDSVNAAIARLEADGRLPALRSTYFIDVPPGPPEVLRVGVTHLPPLMIVKEDGEITGFAVENLREIAARAGLTLTFEQIERADYLKGPQAGEVDLLPALVRTPAREARMDFSIATTREAIQAYALNNTPTRPFSPGALSGQRIGMTSATIAEVLQPRGIDEAVTIFADNDQAFEVLSEGRIDVLVGIDTIITDYAASAEVGGLNALFTEPIYTLETGIPMRFGLGVVRERLNAVIPGYVISERYAELRETYYGAPVLWTPARITLALSVLGAMVVVLLGSLVWQRIRQLQRRRLFERQQAELEREQAHSEELAQLVERLEKSNRDLDEFAYVASHDLKEPLRGIGINAGFLLREELPEQAQGRVHRMRELAGRMETLISDLLFFSRLGQSRGEPGVVDPANTIDAIRADLAEWLAERGGEIVVPGPFPTLRAEPVKVKTVLQNLIVNGIKFNDSVEKRVTVGFAQTADVNGQTLENAVFVADNGIGIKEEYRDKLFRIFSRLNKQGEYGPGTGSGLAFVRKIVEDYGGVTDFNSEPGKGTTFYVTFPLARDTDGADAPAARTRT